MCAKMQQLVDDGGGDFPIYESVATVSIARL